MYFRRQKLCVKTINLYISYGIDQRDLVDCVILRVPYLQKLYNIVDSRLWGILMAEYISFFIPEGI